MPGPTELAIILVIVLILFGAGRLPQVFEALGDGMKRFREAQKEGEGESFLDDPKPSKPAEPVQKAAPKSIEASEASEIADALESEATPRKDAASS